MYLNSKMIKTQCQYFNMVCSVNIKSSLLLFIQRKSVQLPASIQYCRYAGTYKCVHSEYNTVQNNTDSFVALKNTVQEIVTHDKKSEARIERLIKN